MVSLGTVLEQFPDDVIMYVTDPRTGVQRRSEWPPSLAKVVSACEEHQDHLERMRTRPVAQRLPPPEADHRQGAFGNFFVPEGHERYEKMVAWAKDHAPKWSRFGSSSDGRPGIWIPLSVWNGTHLEKIGTT